MRTIRRYAYLLVTGLVAALVFSQAASKLLSRAASAVLSSDGQTASGLYLIFLIGLLIAFAVIRHAVAGLPALLRDRVQCFKRRAAILLVVTALGAVFLLA